MMNSPDQHDGEIGRNPVLARRLAGRFHPTDDVVRLLYLEPSPLPGRSLAGRSAPSHTLVPAPPSGVIGSSAMKREDLLADGDRDLAERLLKEPDVKRAIARLEREGREAGARRQLLGTSIRLTPRQVTNEC